MLIEPSTWVIAFHRATPHRWLRWLAPGRYKHVSAFTFLPAAGLWLVYEIGLSGTRLVLVDGDDRMADFTAGADLIEMPVRSSAGPRPVLFSCVSAVAHLVGAPRCVARPDALWRWCLTHGGTVIGTRPAVLADDRPCNAGAAAPG